MNVAANMHDSHRHTMCVIQAEDVNITDVHLGSIINGWSSVS